MTNATEIVKLYDKQISFIGIARTLGISVKEVLAVLRCAGRIWEPNVCPVCQDSACEVKSSECGK